MRISDWSSDVCSSDLPAQRRQASGAVELGEQVAFQLSDAVFGRDRSPEFKDMAVDEAAGILAMRGQPRRTVHALGRLDMVMEVAVAEMAEGQRADAGADWKSGVLGKRGCVSVDIGV